MCLMRLLWFLPHVQHSCLVVEVHSDGQTMLFHRKFNEYAQVGAFAISPLTVEVTETGPPARRSHRQPDMERR